ncbi:MAG: transglutaminase family protein [Aphanocapsa lilacina HA4352-LM1]|nr:transglutaminase family protein [Aphanocapsa lilacina HA4352-LM1]
MKLSVGCTLGYRCDGPTTLMLTIRPQDGGNQQVLSENFRIEPDLPKEHFEDSFGNRTVRLRPSGGRVQIDYQALVHLQPPFAGSWEEARQVDPGELPPEVVPYLFPSRYCQSDRMVPLANSLVGHLEPGYARIDGLCDWIYENIAYSYGTSDVHTSAPDTVIERIGVCRDFAHLGIALSRALGIPARFVAGYAFKLDPPDFHAYFETYLGGNWYLFDATRKAPREGLVRIATGRDAADTSFANLFGEVTPDGMEVWAHELPDASPPEPAPVETPLSNQVA